MALTVLFPFTQLLDYHNTQYIQTVTFTLLFTFFIPSSVVDFEQLDSYVVKFDDSTKVHNYSMDYCLSVATL